MKLFNCWLIIFIILAASCANTSPVKIERLDKIDSSASAELLADSFAPALDVLARLGGETSRRQALETYRSSAARRVFGPDISSRLPSLAQSEEALGVLRGNLEHLIPSVKFPLRTFGYATPFNQSVILADTVMLIGLNHYLGADYRGYSSFPLFRRRLKEPSRLPLDVAEAVLATSYPYKAQGADATVLSRMLYEGALLYAVSRLLPDFNETEILGFSESEMQWSQDNEQRVWQTMAEADMLYSTDMSLADKILLPAPSSPVINPSAPGRIGRYTGLQIVKNYVRNNGSEVSLEYLLSPDFFTSRQTLRDAAYSPHK